MNCTVNRVASARWLWERCEHCVVCGSRHIRLGFWPVLNHRLTESHGVLAESKCLHGAGKQQALPVGHCVLP